MFKKILKNIFPSYLYPEAYTLNSNFWKNYFLLKRSEWYRIEKIEKIQNFKLRKLIKHAYNNVKYYHDLFRKINLHPDEIKTKEDLKKIPILKKETFKSNFNLLMAKNINLFNPQYVHTTDDFLLR